MKGVLVILSSFCLLASSFAAERKPNILIFLADDLGYADIGVNGCKDIPTPNIDSLARNGVRFTDGYATHCACSPSRAGLMSGMYQHRFGFEHNSGPERYADPNFGLPRSVPTLAERLKNAGYATGMVGKWHIGFKEGLRPHERGFDYHYGFLSGAHTYLPGKFDNDPIMRNGQPVQPTKYLTDEFADEAVAFLERSKDSPFFLYFAFSAVHSPMDENLYQDRFPSLTGKRKILGGMLTALDAAIGRVMDKVREQHQEENTLVMFYSDNGGAPPSNASLNTPLRGMKLQFWEGGIREPFVFQWKGVIPAGQTYREMVMGFDCHATALAAAGVPLPVDKPLDGVNLLPFLLGKQGGRPHDQLFWRSGERHAARVGDWKLVKERGSETELFNLKDDISETTNLAAKERGKLKELQAAYAAWDREMMPAQWVRQDGRNAEEGGAPQPGGKAAGKRVSGIEERFKQYDKNGDGKLTPEEFRTPDFKQMDRNNDGVVMLDEVRAHYQQRRGTPKQ
jgi:arylsulfatase A-like enzyme